MSFRVGRGCCVGDLGSGPQKVQDALRLWFVRLAFALAITGTFSLAAVAQAGDGLCASGYACGYEDLSYNGASFGSAKNTYPWGGVGFADRATSVSANGGSCQYTRYYDDYSYVTGSGSGSYFTMYSRQLLGQNYRDPDLRNGAGFDGAGVNWNDRIGATLFTGCL